MKSSKHILTLIFGVFMILGGVAHFVTPAMYLAFIPNFLPKEHINYGSGIAEIVIGICVFIPRFRTQATLGILVLMVAFLPLHIIDIFRDSPAIGSHQLALIRLPVQCILIGWAWFINKQ